MNNKLYLMYSFLASLVIITITMIFMRYNPIEIYKQVGIETFNIKNIIMIVVRATPVILTGLSVAFAFRAGLFNIGAEGQFIAGSIGALIVGLIPMPYVIHPIFAIIFAGLFGGLLGAAIGYLKARFNINEVLSSIMLNWIAFYFNNLFIDFPMIKRPNSDSSYKILNTARIDLLGEWKKSKDGIKWAIENKGTLAGDILKTQINFGIIIAIILAIVLVFILNKTTLGYKIKAVGGNRFASEYAGIKTNMIFITSMFIAGCISGVAGATNVLGRTFEISTLAMAEGNGFNGIAVAFLASCNLIGVIFSGFLFGFLFQAGSIMQSKFGMPSDIVNIIVGLVLFFISAPLIFKALVKDKQN